MLFREIIVVYSKNHIISLNPPAANVHTLTLHLHSVHWDQRPRYSYKEIKRHFTISVTYMGIYTQDCILNKKNNSIIFQHCNFRYRIFYTHCISQVAYRQTYLFNRKHKKTTYIYYTRFTSIFTSSNGLSAETRTNYTK